MRNFLTEKGLWDTDKEEAYVAELDARIDADIKKANNVEKQKFQASLKIHLKCQAKQWQNKLQNLKARANKNGSKTYIAAITEALDLALEKTKMHSFLVKTSDKMVGFSVPLTDFKQNMVKTAFSILHSQNQELVEWQLVLQHKVSAIMEINSGPLSLKFSTQLLDK